MLIACEEDYYLHTEEFKPKIVVNSVFTVKQPWSVNLTYSKNLLDHSSTIKPITDAQVHVVEKSNGRIIILNNIGNGEYKSDIYPPLADKLYELHVKVDGYEEVTASSTSPKNAEVKIIADVVERVDFEIKDDNKNYYIWNLIFTNGNPPQTNYTTDPKNLVNGIIKYNNLAGFISSQTSPNPNDGELSGVQSSVYNKETVENGSTGGGSNGQNNTNTKKYLRLLTVSKDLYQYYKSIETFASVENHNSSFSQNPEVHTNITNGLGIFAGYTEILEEIK